MRSLLALAAVTLLLGVSAAAAGEYALIWNGPLDNGIETRVPGFFVGAQGAANRGVHLVVGDAVDWDGCTYRIDLGEIRRHGFDGVVTFDIGGLIESPPFYLHFVRGENHRVHEVHEVFYSARTGRPVIEIESGPPGPPGQPVAAGGSR